MEKLEAALMLLINRTVSYEKDGTKLLMPTLYFGLSEEEQKTMWDKYECGPGDGWFARKIVPDTMWGLDISLA